VGQFCVTGRDVDDGHAYDLGSRVSDVRSARKLYDRVLGALRGARGDVSRAHLGDRAAAVIAMRSRPRLLILDEELRIVFADWSAMFTVFRLREDPVEVAERLPHPLEDAVREAISSWSGDAPAESVVEPLPDLVLRISRLSGLAQNFIAVVCETRARRGDLDRVAKEFSLTRREQEVLGLVLHGWRAVEIADELMIAETTVQDYFKQLLRKTKSKNRSEMIARVLGWEQRA
jgi:DNA-binding CsgD family transcriptional regulator